MPLPNVNDFIGTNVTQGKFKQAQKQLIEYVEQLGNNVSAAAGGKYGFNTIADFEAVKSSLPNNSVVNIASGSDAGDYVWNGSILTKSPNDSLTQSKKYTDDHVKPLKKLVGEAESELLEAAVDQDGFAYRTTDANGNVQFAGKKLGFNESGIEEITNNAPFLVLDKDEKVVLYIDKESNLHVPNGIFYGGGSLDENLRNVANDISSEKIYRKIAGQTYQNAVISRQQHMSQFTSIMTLAESNGLRNRMIAGVKISTGLFVVWHQQTKSQYDGDGSGSAFWSAFIDIDENLQVTVRDKKLFIYPDTDAGIIKHPHLGWTNDNRLIMVYEKSVGYAEATPQNPVDYIKYVVYSADEGVTWTSPIQLKYINSPPTTQLKALGTTCEVLKLKSGRLIVALYSGLGHSGCIYSDDDGLNWVYSDKFINESNWGFEPSICPDSDGHLVMVMRPKANTNLHAGFAKSKDNGLSWEMMHSNRVVSVTNQSFLLYDEAFGVHLYSHDVNELNRRTNYRISISYDDCNTFPLTYAPFPDSRYVGYTQLMKWSDGIYLLLMEYNDVWQGINSNEQLGIQIINAKEVFNNVTRSKI
ncbi:TPA: exo-alpha-sialidase [Acinetobacter baumannii]|uniref:sialidase family protein n=1 Tax=Acinetobacter baumannii TaxID=470 RepID=UPI0007EB52EB|nr:sialidase family protein [Acinetobacter baumannii]MDC4346349.1 glycoside hydrolase [Acinetobacter baumannii]QTM21295.1 exo-alpha-sialidase [Acinetobacter baumannii]RSF52873.1 exo-alpha-sialidase [Acinetobacter baumannii]RSF61009.1 exo-alpha-sialidase [Acinetobacter baumannii]SBS22551.1 Neuraminidase (sialidase) [Acinetobacter baumannii]